MYGNILRPRGRTASGGSDERIVARNEPLRLTVRRPTDGPDRTSSRNDFYRSYVRYALSDRPLLLSARIATAHARNRITIINNPSTANNSARYMTIPYRSCKAHPPPSKYMEQVHFWPTRPPRSQSHKPPSSRRPCLREQSQRRNTKSGPDNSASLPVKE